MSDEQSGVAGSEGVKSDFGTGVDCEPADRAFLIDY